MKEPFDVIVIGTGQAGPSLAVKMAQAGQRAAKFLGAKVIGIPLTKDHAHDVRAMVNADPNAGLIYLCNPNNPSGTLTSRADIEWALANKPAGSIVLLDEAYIHFSSAWEDRCSDLVAKDRDLIVLRTFSKLYGLAAFRAGLALGRPDLLAKLPLQVRFLAKRSIFRLPILGWSIRAAGGSSGTVTRRPCWWGVARASCR